jgi:hypothetical protein
MSAGIRGAILGEENPRAGLIAAAGLVLTAALVAARA